MTVLTETTQWVFMGDDVTTVFPFAAPFFEHTDVVVQKDDGSGYATLAEGAQYTLTGGGGDVGEVTLASPLLGGETLKIYRAVPIVQAVDLSTYGDFDPDTHEEMLDRAVMNIQQLKTQMGELLTVSIGGDASVLAGDGLAIDSGRLSVVGGNGLTVTSSVAVDFGASEATVDVRAPTPGVAEQASRADHGHAVAVGSPEALVAGGAALDGNEFKLARSDHRHALPAAAPSKIVNAATNAGGSSSVARADHVHGVDYDAPVNVGAANAAGSSTKLALADHVHNHGTHTDANAHAVATDATAGFMSAADKSALSALNEEATLTTTDATPSKLYTFRPDDNTATCVVAEVSAIKSDGTEGAAFVRAFSMRRHGGLVAVGAVSSVHTAKDAAAWDVAVSYTSPEAYIVVTGAAATTIKWKARVRRTIVTA